MKRSIKAQTIALAIPLAVSVAAVGNVAGQEASSQAWSHQGETSSESGSVSEFAFEALRRVQPARGAADDPVQRLERLDLVQQREEGVQRTEPLQRPGLVQPELRWLPGRDDFGEGEHVIQRGEPAPAITPERRLRIPDFDSVRQGERETGTLVQPGRAGLPRPRRWPYNHVNGDGYGLDLLFYCVETWGTPVRPVLKDRDDAYTWRCERRYESGGAAITSEESIDLEQASRMQYGPLAKVHLRSRQDPGSWYVMLPEHRKMRGVPDAYQLYPDLVCKEMFDDPQLEARLRQGGGWRCVNPFENPPIEKGAIDAAQACAYAYGPGALPEPVIHPRYCALLETGRGAMGPVMTDFDVRRHGFKFSNIFEGGLVVKLPVFGEVRLEKGYGLCGGMVYAAKDTYWSERVHGQRTEVPGTHLAPGRGSQLRQYIWDRQMDSLKGTARPPNWRAVTKLAHWLAKPIEKVEELSTAEFQNTIAPRLRNGVTVPLMVVISPAFDKNHQVLAVGYDGENIRVYDPNCPNEISTIRGTRRLDCLDRPIRGFFVTSYQVQRPYWVPSPHTTDPDDHLEREQDVPPGAEVQ